MKEVRDRKSAGEQQNHHPHREEAASSSSLSSSLSSVAQGMTIGDGATTSPSESSSPSSLLLCEPGGLERKCPTLPSPSGNVTHVVIGTQGAAVHVQHVGAEYGSFTQHQYSGDVQVMQPGSNPSSPVSTPRPLSFPGLPDTSRIILPHGGGGSNMSSSNLHHHHLLHQHHHHCRQHLQQQQKGELSSSLLNLSMDAMCATSTTTATTTTNNNVTTNTADPNWQSLKPTLRERNAAMFDNELMSDVVFVVGPPSACQRIFAHKYVLATGSAVFFAMFHGGLAETKLEIAVPDVDPLAFRTLLRYLYMDDTQMKADVVLSTLYAAKKYMVPFLARACVAFLERSLTAENACVLLSQARLLDEPDLTQRCWEVVDAQAEMALTADGLADVDHATLVALLSRPTLNCRESVVLKAAVAWASAQMMTTSLHGDGDDEREEEEEEDDDDDDDDDDHHHCCSGDQQQEKEGCSNVVVVVNNNNKATTTTTKNTATKKYENNDDAVAQRLRRVLGDAVFLIRFPAMSLDEFANEAAQSGVLTLQETKDVFLHLTATQKPALRFCAVPRRGLQAQVCHRFGSCAYRSNQWRYRGRCDSIQFCVDKRVFVVGFGLYGSSNGAAEYSVRMELKRGGSNGDGCSGASSSSSSSSPPPLLGECVTKLVSDGSSNTFHVHFPHPIQIEADQYYTASCVLDGGELSYFGQEGMSEVQAGCVTFQFQCSVDSTNGTGVQGGQIPEIIFYGPSSSASPPLP